MMNGKVYRNIKTREIVFEEDAKDYALDNVGIKVTPKGKNGELTVEQLDIIDMLVDWYYDADWIMEEYEDEEAEERAYRQELENQKELEYQYNKERI